MLVLGWILAAVIGWLLWSGILWVVGTRVFGHDAEFGAIARVVALAHATGLLYGAAALPGLTEWEGLVRLTTLLWFLGTLFVATRAVFAVPVRRALLIYLVALACRVVVEQAPTGLRMVPGT
jgi:hypothetical protein